MRGVIVILVWLCSMSIAAAQSNSGAIGGVVRDSSGGVLPGASIVARHAATGTVVERIADAEGRFFPWEIFNGFNRANFDLPNRIYGSANFGRIFSAKNAREMQLGIRYTF